MKRTHLNQSSHSAIARSRHTRLRIYYKCTWYCSTDDDCDQINMPSSKDKFRKRENYAVHGHSLSKHSTRNHNSCFLKCAQNCQCLSANYKQYNENENCYLNEAASYTNPESIKVTWGWWYYEMVRSYLKNVNFVFTIILKPWRYKSGIELAQWTATLHCSNMFYLLDRES